MIHKARGNILDSCAARERAGSIPRGRGGGVRAAPPPGAAQPTYLMKPPRALNPPATNLGYTPRGAALSLTGYEEVQ
jgi:hypothetical protein